MTELRRCPFCGGEARISELTYPMKHYTVICSNEKCYAEMGDFISNEDAIRMWNTRPNPWHTGTPTEGGLFLVLWNDTEEPMRRYSILHWNEYNGTWYDEETPSCNWGDEYHAEVVAWQKITPYEEN